MDLRLFKVGGSSLAEEQIIHRDVGDGVLLVVAAKGGGGHAVGVDADLAQRDVGSS
jgi:hypothetical protein